MSITNRHSDGSVEKKKNPSWKPQKKHFMDFFHWLLTIFFDILVACIYLFK